VHEDLPVGHTKAIQALNQQIQGNGANPASVAQQFLAANGLK